ncbi:RHS repeat-associated core domain-containing protein [Pseudomonas sp. SWRI153]|uniref:RHS repeat-associated core domain-containing protein n=1 Tax=Pseudomonas khorasanensis TaxID=2745508 RepID=A0A923F297_9PSED|nr:RHS repeat-associated core domain-containing protein [Pseudomonas khorasanensis]MBV4485395.1 RHS repeat-associated core domain-containing protein [Pseudomonas khorasanensis]
MKYAAVHSRTPVLAVIDARGLPIREIAYLRTLAEDTPKAHVSRQLHDVAGRVVAQQDPRLPAANATKVYSLNGETVFADSVDAGWHLLLPGLAGEPRLSWDERGHRWQSTFDDQLRVVQFEITGNGENQADTYSYGTASAEAEYNLRGQLIRQSDPSGSLDITSHALTGQALVERRTFHDDEPFTSQQVFSPLGALLEQIDAGGHRRHSRYGLAGQLRAVDLLIKGQEGKPVLLDAQYNANDQPLQQQAGNGVLSQWTYDPADGRLHTQSSRKEAGPPLQDFEYFYDGVGNITRIENHAFEPAWFANQRVDGHREFSYDSLYRLIRATGYDDAPPSDIPGLPQPTDPKNRLNYTQTYAYDDGGNLIKSCHTRDGNCHSRQMFVDPNSNRAVRWKPGEADPDFDVLFDRHGNLQDLKQGPSLQWNARDELQSVSLVTRQDSDSDAEHYRYSQGQRVFKCHEWFTQNRRHFHQVRYLPGLEIRNKDNGEELHIISVGNARCLHWVSPPPATNDQLRYRLEDHLGSCVMELDENATVTSEEGYYPFGETAWMAPQSEIQYRFIRYSGKEMDVSGLYYYGARYYAPWLQRWVSADPAGDVDGLNLYAFVANNPMIFTDPDGQYLETSIDGPPETSTREVTPRSARSRLSREVFKHTEIVKLSKRRAKDAKRQILNHRSALSYGASIARRTGAHLASQAVSYGAGIVVGIGASALGAAAGPPGVITGFAVGFAAKKAISLGFDYALERAGLSASIKLKAGKLDPQRIVKKGEYKTGSYVTYASHKFQALVAGVIALNRKGFLKGTKEGISFGASNALSLTGTAMGSEISAALSSGLGLPEIAHEIIGAAGELSPEKISKLDQNINGLVDVLNTGMNNLETSFRAAGVNAINTFSYDIRKNSAPTGDTVQSLRNMTNSAIRELRYTQTILHSRSSRFTAV